MTSAAATVTAATPMPAADQLQNLVDTVLDTIVDGVVTINARGEIQSFNKACVKLFGYHLEEVRGKNVKILMPEPYRSEHNDYLENYAKTRNAKIIGIGREVSGQRKDGSVFPMELAVGETHTGGNHAFVGIIRDISERKEAEKVQLQLFQLQNMESLGQLTGGIAHDFNNLLAIILGNLDFLQDEFEPNHVLRKFIDPAIQAALHGSELTQRLLAFGRKQTLHPQITALNGLIGHFVGWATRTLGERVEISLSLADNLWPVKVDPGQLEGVLLNLAVNARDAMPEGGKLIFETRNVVIDDAYAAKQVEFAAGEYVMLAVSDTGSGMPPEVIEKAFEPFFTTKGVGKGSGLGLSMAYGFVKQSAGHIRLYSEPGVGTSVKIYLPRAEGTPMPLDAQPGPRSAKAAGRKYTVLVVEDNKLVLDLTSRVVESMGHEALTAEHGAEAMAILRERGDISLLLTDVMLPGNLNGPALAKQALKLYPELKVLFVSGYAEHAIFEGGLLEQGMHLISKPFHKQQLVAKIDTLLTED